MNRLKYLVIVGPYALLLNASHYSALLDNASSGSVAHTALMAATPPTMGRSYILICSEKAVEQLMDLGARCCPESISEISRQFERQKSRSEVSVFLVYRKQKDSADTEWHFHTRCSHWPATDYIQTRYIDSGVDEGLCTECLELDAATFGKVSI